MLTKVRHITREMVRRNPQTLFVFGDNMERRGFGGQAREMRGEPNAVGIPTKRSPAMTLDAFFTDEDFFAALVEISFAHHRLLNHAKRGGKIVWPMDGIGTGLAELKIRAPAIWNAIELCRTELENLP